MQLTGADLKKMFPRGQKLWLEALERLAPELVAAGEVTTCERWCLLMSQVDAETSGLSLKSMRENMNYKPKRILEVFDYRVRKAQRDNPQFRGKSLTEIAAALAASPDLLAETVYGNRKDIGNTRPGDGARYIGRSPLQTTGWEWYEKLSKELGIDLVAEPHRLEEPEIGWRAAFIEWKLLGCNAIADRGSVELVSRRVNGGTNGMAHRKVAYARALTIWPDQDAVIDTPITPRLADKAPAEVTAKTVAADGSRSMSWLLWLRNLLGASGVTLLSFTGADTLGGFRGTLNELKTILTDHVLVVGLLAVGVPLVVILVAQHFLVKAVQDGRYEPRKG